jgi:hypothetical protein
MPAAYVKETVSVPLIVGFLPGDRGVHGEPGKTTLQILHELPVKKLRVFAP